jgi:hypothetical protein
MRDPKTLFTYEMIGQPMTGLLATMLTREIEAWGPELDRTVAEMIVVALATNDVRGEHHVVLDLAEVRVWPVKPGIYVAEIEGHDFVDYAFLPDTAPATLEARVKLVCSKIYQH